MDPLTAIRILVAVGELGLKVYDRVRARRETQQSGFIVNSQGGMQEIPSVSGVLSVPDVTSSHPVPTEPTVTIFGEFLFAESLDWLRGDEVVLVLIFEEHYQSLGEFYLFSFDLGGYAVSLWPGDYSFYMFVLDPEAPTMYDAEILAVGYPDFGEVADPNPISISGYGDIDMDMLVFDREAFYDVPRYLSDLAE